MKRRRKPVPAPAHDPDWAKKVVAKMSDAEVKSTLARMGYEPFRRELLGPKDTRSPIERMIDEATGHKPSR